MKLVLIVLMLSVSIITAGNLTANVAGISETYLQGTDVEIVYWTQPPTGGLMASQYFDDLYPAYDAGVADDFEFTVSTSINRIRWWGGYWSGAVPPVVSPVEIYLYFDDDTGGAPTLPQHTTAIASWMVAPGDYTEVADGSDWRCEYDFPTLVTFDPGVKYWIEIRKAFPFDPLGQYGLVRSEPINLAPCVQGFDGMGIVWWTAEVTDAAFELIWVIELSLEKSTWADIKATF